LTLAEALRPVRVWTGFREGRPDLSLFESAPLLIFYALMDRILPPDLFSTVFFGIFFERFRGDPVYLGVVSTVY